MSILLRRNQVSPTQHVDFILFEEKIGNIPIAFQGSILNSVICLTALLTYLCISLILPVGTEAPRVKGADALPDLEI